MSLFKMGNLEKLKKYGGIGRIYGSVGRTYGGAERGSLLVLYT